MTTTPTPLELTFAMAKVTEAESDLEQGQPWSAAVALREAAALLLGAAKTIERTI